MSNPAGRSLFRPVLIVVVVLLILFFHTHGSSRDASTMSQEPTHDAGALSKLTVRIRQSSTSPPTLTLSVTNDHTSPLTILRWNTPLDPVALAVGVLSVTPEGEDTPLELDLIALKRLMPPPEDDIVTLHPGESREQEVVLREPALPFDKLGKKPRIAAKGKWQTVWPTTADKLSKETIEKLQFGDGVLSGDFETEAIEVTLP
ncbi:hypothetical protein CkaCkLH20_11940 [Colletotrichum karsti]|uniref:Secreted protein n=1 Tax=Colletotrichum karsti TaxID=1095194 RepID=A0A9P6HUJ6_9PEZI|nr:uncharacterized protein CkaCkLH20_11940 [Colletotrichum karsti]KAF9870634.1 hypothetical protein CkaCkLH20_11940 [Colletotrichum karsti]